MPDERPSEATDDDALPREPATSNLPPEVPQFTVRTLLMAVAGLCVFFAGLAAVERSREQVRRDEHALQFKEILFRMHHYNESLGKLPAAAATDARGKPINSWRFQLAPYFLSCIAHTFDLSASWKAPANVPYTNWRHEHFCLGAVIEKPRSDQQTCIFAVTGPGTAFEHGRACPIEDLDPDTILIVEVRDSGVHWAQPGDFDIRTMPREINPKRGPGISGNMPSGFHVGFADCQVWCLRNDVPFDVLYRFFTIEGAKESRREDALAEYRL